MTERQFAKKYSGWTDGYDGATRTDVESLPEGELKEYLRKFIAYREVEMKLYNLLTDYGYEAG